MAYGEVLPTGEGRYVTPAAPIRGWGPVAMLNLRCWGVLAAANTPVLYGLAVVTDGGIAGVSIILAPALLIAGALILIVGYPAGLITARLLASLNSERVHILAFASAGAALSIALVSPLQLGVAGLLVAALEGALGAGVARLWSGRDYRRRHATVPAPARAEVGTHAPSPLDGPDTPARNNFDITGSESNDPARTDADGQPRNEP